MCVVLWCVGEPHMCPHLTSPDMTLVHNSDPGLVGEGPLPFLLSCDCATANRTTPFVEAGESRICSNVVEIQFVQSSIAASKLEDLLCIMHR